MKLDLSTSADAPAKNFISTAYDFEVPLAQKKLHQPQALPLDITVKKLLHEKVKVFDTRRVATIVFSKKTIAQKIIDIFLLDDVLTGDRKYIEESRDFLEKQLNFFIQSKKQIVFTLLQFPFKAPNPLKTERTLPDLGEVGYLYQLHLLAEAIKEVYPQGVKFIILGESLVFRDIADISMGEALQYRETSRWWIKELGFEKTIELVELRDMEKKIPSFYTSLRQEEFALAKAYYKKDKDTLSAVQTAFPTLFLTLNVRNLSQEILMKVFSKTEKLQSEEKEIVTELERNAIEATLRYLPYHMTVKKTHMREKIWPHNIGLSPISKPNRFGVFPLNRYNKLYPMHGVAVYTKAGYIVTRYKIDVLRDKNIKYAYMVSYGAFDNHENKEKDPFFYSEVRL